MKFLMIAVFMFNLSFAKGNLFEEAGEYYRIDPYILWSIAKIESKFNPKATNKNTNGTMDIGLMQINTIHLPELKKLGFRKEHLFDPKINVFAGAMILKRCFGKHGVTPNGMTCYNGRIKNNDYGAKVMNELKGIYIKVGKYKEKEVNKEVVKNEVKENEERNIKTEINNSQIPKNEEIVKNEGVAKTKGKES